jgi:hypothetical protein
MRVTADDTITDTATKSPSEGRLPTTSAARVELIRELAAKLPDSTILNTVKSRARCRQLAGEMMLLLDEEDACQSRPSCAPEDNRAARERFMEVVRTFRETVEHATASRLYVVSQRVRRKQDKQEKRSG